MARELKEINFDKINFETEVINNLFQQIENKMIIKSFLRNKKEEVVPFKGGLPQVPLIVGLVGKVPDNINNLISKFVGYQSKIAESIKKTMSYFESVRHKTFRGYKDFGEFVLISKTDRITGYTCRRFLRLRKIDSVKLKMQEFMKLPKWLRKRLIKLKQDELFPKNPQFVKSQKLELGLQ